MLGLRILEERSGQMGVGKCVGILTKLMELSNEVRMREFSLFSMLSVMIGKTNRSPRSRSMCRPSLASTSIMAPCPTALEPAGPAPTSFRRTTCWNKKSHTSLVTSSCGMYPVIEGSHGPRSPSCCGSGAGGWLSDGPLTGAAPSAMLLVGVGVCAWTEEARAGAAAMDDDRMRAAHGLDGESRACFGIGGRGFGIVGPVPRVRAHRCAKIGGSLYRLLLRLGSCGLEPAVASGVRSIFEGNG